MIHSRNSQLWLNGGKRFDESSLSLCEYSITPMGNVRKKGWSCRRSKGFLAFPSLPLHSFRVTSYDIYRVSWWSINVIVHADGVSGICSRVFCPCCPFASTHSESMSTHSVTMRMIQQDCGACVEVIYAVAGRSRSHGEWQGVSAWRGDTPLAWSWWTAGQDVPNVIVLDTKINVSESARCANLWLVIEVIGHVPIEPRSVPVGRNSREVVDPLACLVSRPVRWFNPSCGHHSPWIRFALSDFSWVTIRHCNKSLRCLH